MDLKISWDGVAFSGDFLPGANDDGIETAILISLFSDARARDDDSLPETETNRRGWWGAELLDPEQFGCRWWMRWREKQIAETAAQFVDDARDALAWMIASGVALSMEIDAAWVRRGVLGFAIVFHLADGSRRLLEGEATP